MWNWLYNLNWNLQMGAVHLADTKISFDTNKLHILLMPIIVQLMLQILLFLATRHYYIANYLPLVLVLRTYWHSSRYKLHIPPTLTRVKTFYPLHFKEVRGKRKTGKKNNKDKIIHSNSSSGIWSFLKQQSCKSLAFQMYRDSSIYMKLDIEVSMLEDPSWL